MKLDLTLLLVLATVVGSISAVIGYLLMRRKFEKEIKVGLARQEELAQKAYETLVLKEIGDRIGYSLDGGKIIEIISGSLDRLLPYSTASHLILDEKQGKIFFSCDVKESVSRTFIDDVRTKMLAGFSAMRQEATMDSEVDESISGAILDETKGAKVKSFFNLPIVISGKLVGMINVSSSVENQYTEENTAVLYRIAKQASDAVSRLVEVLANEKGKLSQAVKSLADGVLMVDVKYQLVLVNKKLCQLLGIVNNPSIFDIVNALAGQLDLRTKMEEAIAKNQTLGEVEIRVGERVLSVVASPVMDRRGDKPMGVVVLFHDVTDAKSLEDLRNEFTSVMVHELRAPLTSIKSTVEMLRADRAANPNLAKSLGVIESTSQTMLSLVNDILDVAKLEAGKFDIVSENGNLGEVCAERVEGFKPLAQNKNLKLNLVVESNLPEGYFDKIRIKQVLNNLLSNAIKYTDAGSITVRVKKRVVNGGTVDILVSVADTGIGIEPDQVEKLFLRFGQLAGGRKQAGLKSSGLGLYIAKSIVEGIGGKIWVESPGTGLGSTFNFTVPLAKEEKVTPSVSKDKGPVATITKVAQA